MVRTTNRSIEATRQPDCAGRFSSPASAASASLIMYLPTVDSETSNPSINSSPWIRGAPHSGFSLLIRRISARSSPSILGLPPRRQDFQRQ